jgi:hypothetical protein
MKKTTKLWLTILTTIFVIWWIYAWTDLTSPQKQAWDTLLSSEWNTMQTNLSEIKTNVWNLFSTLLVYATDWAGWNDNLTVTTWDTLSATLWNNTQSNINLLKEKITEVETNAVTTLEVYWDENAEAISACNKWVADNTSWKWEWIWVPARYFTTDWQWVWLTDNYYKKSVTYNSKNYICKWFAVAKYEMSYSNDIAPTSIWEWTDWNTIWWTSHPTCTRASSTSNSWESCSLESFTNHNWGIASISGRYPIADITQHAAIPACKSIWAHLKTNNEWMGIARNIEQQVGNWVISTSSVAYIPNWVSNDTAHWCWGTNTKTQYVSLTRSRATKTWGWFWNTACDEKRQLTLSNWAKIWDLAGNIWEHTNKANTIDWNNYNSNSFRLSNACWGNTRYSFSGNDWVAECSWANSYTYNNIWPTTISLNSANWIWRIYSYNTENNIFLRGGAASDAAGAGLFALNLIWAVSSQNRGVGFRCSL